MNEKTIEFETMTFQFEVDNENWKLSLAKSQTHVKDISQLALITNRSDYFVPAKVRDEDDSFVFSFAVNPKNKQWEDVKKLQRNDKLRLLTNIARFQDCLSSRMTFFLHPDNLVFNDNLIPSIVYRGIRELIPPYVIDATTFLRQYKCLAVALFSKKYSFDELYNGSLNNAKETEFERKINEINDLHILIQFLEDSYSLEQKAADQRMQLVPKKQFRLFKQLAITMIALSILLAIPLAYIGLVKMPYQEKLLAAHHDFLASDYGQVISDLEGQNAEKLPNATKYILANSYINSEVLGPEQKTAIMKNISLKSDPSYLLYWIYNGRGDLEKSTDLAKYIDDPVLIIYGIIKQIEQVKNDPDITGSEREEQVKKLNEQLKGYQEQYNLLPEDDVTNPELETDEKIDHVEENPDADKEKTKTEKTD